jgi:hypothetical protein
MGIADYLWMAVILGGAGWLLYNFLWKKKGSCPGCDGGSTPKKKYSVDK